MEDDAWMLNVKHVLVALVTIALCVDLLVAQQPLRNVTDPGVVTTRQNITPAGIQAVFAGRVHAVAFCGSDLAVAVFDSQPLYVSTLYRLSVSLNQVIDATTADQQLLGIQGMACVPRTGDVLVSLANQDNGKLAQSVSMLSEGPRLSGLTQTAAAPVVDRRHLPWPSEAMVSGQLGTGWMGGIGVAGNSSVAAVALTGSNEVAVVDLAQR